MCAPSIPEPPDPKETAAAQTGTNVSTAVANSVMQNPNQVTPYGTMTTTFGGGAPDIVPVYANGMGPAEAPAITTTGGVDPNDYNSASTAAVASAYNPESYSVGGKTFDNMADAQAYQATLTPTGEDAQAQSYQVGDQSFATYDEALAYQNQLNGAGTYEWTDPSTGDVYEIPIATITQELSPEQQQILDSSTEAQINLANVAAQQSQRLYDVLGEPMDMSTLPDSGSYNADQGAMYSQQRGDLYIDDMQQASGNVADSGEIMQSVDPRTGEVTNDLSGQTYQTGFDSGGNIQREIDEFGNITETYGTDFSEDRQRVEEAMYSRIDPQLERDREALHTQLVNQGINEGSEAYDRAMNRMDEQANDAYMQVILAGGQEQTRMADLEAQRAGFENAAQQQAYQQALGQATFTNQAQMQAFGQNQAQAQFGNQAMQSQFDTDLAQINQRNAAAAQRFQQDQAAANFANQAQNQMFTQNFTQQELANQAALQNNSALMDQNAFNLGLTQADQQAYYQQLARQDAERQQALNEAYAARNQPLNEIGALLGTGQVTQPNFVNPNMGAIPTTDYAGIVNTAYGQEMAGYQAQSSMMGSLLGAAGTVGGAYLGTF